MKKLGLENKDIIKIPGGALTCINACHCVTRAVVWFRELRLWPCFPKREENAAAAGGGAEGCRAVIPFPVSFGEGGSAQPAAACCLLSPGRVFGRQRALALTLGLHGMVTARCNPGEHQAELSAWCQKTVRARD